MNKSRNKGDLSSRTISHIKLKSKEIIPEKEKLTRNKPIAFTTLSLLTRFLNHVYSCHDFYLL